MVPPTALVIERRHRAVAGDLSASQAEAGGAAKLASDPPLPSRYDRLDLVLA